VKKKKKNLWKALGLVTTGGVGMPIILYLNKTRIGRYTGMVGAISEDK
jgi:hypothetical protein